ncbi:hypothetical protein ACVWWK_005060 [Bradyrhizobium sp. LB9.1b]
MTPLARSQIPFDFRAKRYQTNFQVICSSVRAPNQFAEIGQATLKSMMLAYYSKLHSYSHFLSTFNHVGWKSHQVIDHFFVELEQGCPISRKALAVAYNLGKKRKDRTESAHFYIWKLRPQIIDTKSPFHNELARFQSQKNVLWIKIIWSEKRFQKLARLPQRRQLAFDPILFPADHANSQLPLNGEIANNCGRYRHRRCNNISSESKPVGPTTLSADIDSERHPHRQGEKRNRHPRAEREGRNQKRRHLQVHTIELPAPFQFVERVAA